MFKCICLFGLIACVYGLPPQQRPQDVQASTILLQPTTETVDTKEVRLIKSAVEPNNQETSILPRPQASIRLAGLSPLNNQRLVKVLHKPAAPLKSLDDQETLDNAASEWWNNQWENYWWQNNNNQFGGYTPYSYGGWEQPQYYYRSYGY